MHLTIVKTISAAALAVISLSSPYAMAQTSSPGSASISNASNAYRPSAEEVGDFDNVYRLDNHQIMSLRIENGHFLANIKGKREVELYPKGPGLFMTRAGTTLEFLNGREQVILTDADLLPGIFIAPGQAHRTIASR
ncbi:hypothetical protein [Janthinobacterium agaricidamnosum]|uniref:Uncharacterized protein n=1 Tax=Janthinobacterium agaricidamnosum NBRC 102515 = DSM 9628 TaxID=1349767 RepID=W0VB76_9BURK|nr:hypothetical protein [Janthinobacterium agaricidamnosum]CDG84512.1 hypothetical protein GJA_3901 [Janthinobacterium agaricidamnosum NBRC 102515 = DSM 9628]